MTSIPPPLASLRLAGDGDDLDLLAYIEDTFDIRFDDAEVSGCITVGDVYQALLGKFPTATVSGKCATAMAFYSIRRFLRAQGVSGPIRPRDQLSDLTNRPRVWLLADLAQHTATRPLDGADNSATLIGCVFVTVGCAALAAGTSLLAVLTACTAVYAGAAIMRTSLRPCRNMTVGELSITLAGRNFARFAARGADRRDHTVWTAFQKLLAEMIDEDAARITKSTRLMA